MITFSLEADFPPLTRSGYPRRKDEVKYQVDSEAFLEKPSSKKLDGVAPSITGLSTTRSTI